MGNTHNKNTKTLKDEIRQKYDKFARWYDLVVGILEVMGIRKLRGRLLRSVSGNVLEIAVGTGKNLRHYSKTSHITAIDMSPGMLEVARRRANSLGLEIAFSEMDAESLTFPDHSFDTVVSSLTLCTFPDPVLALREMARVCRPTGRILLLEHGRSNREWLGQWQDRKAASHAEMLGCCWNREPHELVLKADLTPTTAHRHLLGILHVLEVHPS